MEPETITHPTRPMTASEVATAAAKSLFGQSLRWMTIGMSIVIGAGIGLRIVAPLFV